MNCKTTTISAFCLFSLAFIIACGAQNDSLSIDKAFIEELMSDPLTEQANVVHQKQTNLMLYNRLDMAALSEIVRITPENDVCKITADMSQIEHAIEYFDNMCKQINLMRLIQEKYPQVKDLETETYAKIFYHLEPVTTEDVLLIIESRNKID